MKLLVAFLVAGASLIGHPPAKAHESALQHSVEQLRSAIGSWRVTTELLNLDGSVARTVTGTYEFSWVVPDRVVAGRSAIPDLDQVSGILFYVNEAQNVIEMASVGRDGRLWIMTGELGQEVRKTQEFPTASGGKRVLRFTRFNVTANRFESRMDFTDDGGETWKPGNHQVFDRVPAR